MTIYLIYEKNRRVAKDRKAKVEAWTRRVNGPVGRSGGLKTSSSEQSRDQDSAELDSHGFRNERVELVARRFLRCNRSKIYSLSKLNSR